MAKRISLLFHYPINLGERKRPNVNAAVGFTSLKIVEASVIKIHILVYTERRFENLSLHFVD